MLQDNGGKNFHFQNFNCAGCDYEDTHAKVGQEEANRFMDLILTIFEPDLPKHPSPPLPKKKRKRRQLPKRCLEKVADLAAARINGTTVLCSEIDQGRAFYVMPVNSATGLPKFELYKRKPEKPAP